MDPKIAPANTKPRKKSRWFLWLLLFLLFCGGAVGAYIYAATHFSYSSGERAGYVQKISRKGWVCKTWEGELAVTNFPGTAPQIFTFSVPDERVAHEIERVAGQRVALAYEQHKGVPGACFAETEYWVTGVRALGQ